MALEEEFLGHEIDADDLQATCRAVTHEIATRPASDSADRPPLSNFSFFY